jgi:hypothetical protein
MAHTETFDPKKYTPFEKGMEGNRVLSTFPSVPTVLDGINFSEGLQEIGKVMDKGTVIRSYVAADLGHILHSRHQFNWHTCYEPPQTVAAPHIGAWIAKELGPKNPVIPAFVDIGQRFTVGEAEELKAFHTAGFLGNEFGPFFIPDPSQGLDSVRPPIGMDLKRFEARNKLYKELAWIDPETKLIWLPQTINEPKQGMVFANGTGVDNWKWAAVKAVPVTEEEQHKFPIPKQPGKFYEFRMDMETLQHFDEKDFIEALDYIGLLTK